MLHTRALQEKETELWEWNKLWSECIYAKQLLTVKSKAV